MEAFLLFPTKEIRNSGCRSSHGTIMKLMYCNHYNETSIMLSERHKRALIEEDVFSQPEHFLMLTIESFEIKKSCTPNFSKRNIHIPIIPNVTKLTRKLNYKYNASS